MKRRRNDARDGRASPEGQVHSLDLARLDRDLRSISIEERGSFGPELRAELAAEYAGMQSAGPSRRSGTRVGLLAAAAVVLLLLGGWLVPPARASLARLLQLAPKVEPVSVDPLPEVSPPAAVVVEMGMEELPVLEDLREDPAPDTPVDGGPVDGPPPPLPPTLPSLVGRELARRIVTAEYPVRLQKEGIGGVVRVLLWVRPDGTPESPTVRSSSGVAELDEAALRAIRSFRFLAATRAGQKVGTWVEFSIRFQPNVTGSQPDPEYQAFEIPLGN